MKNLQLYSWVKETDVHHDTAVLLTGLARRMKGNEVRSRWLSIRARVERDASCISCRRSSHLCQASDTREILDADHEDGRDQERRSTQPARTCGVLGFEYQSVHEACRRGSTVKPTDKYVGECWDIDQLRNAKAGMTPLTELKSTNLHDETTVCDQAQHTLFRAVVGKLQYITGVRPDRMLVTKYLSYKLGSPTLADLTRAKKALRHLKGTPDLKLYLTIPALKPNDLSKTLKHVTLYSLMLIGLVIRCRGRAHPVPCVTWINSS